MEIIEPGFHYHIFNRGNNREKLFYHHDDYVYFQNLYLKYLYPVTDLYCYCLLPNHFHFLVRFKESEEIESFELSSKKPHQHFSNFFNAYAKYINNKYFRTGSLFQERYKRKRVEDEIYLKHLIHYIHTNPAHHELTTDFINYPYSSYQIHLKKGKTILKRETVIEYFDDVENYIYTHKERVKLMLIKSLVDGD